jgi:hypothetical protein
VKKWRKIRGVIISDGEALRDALNEAGRGEDEPLFFRCLCAAMEMAKKDKNGFAWVSSGKVFSTASIDESGRLLQAEFYVKLSEYRDAEIFKEAGDVIKK